MRVTNPLSSFHFLFCINENKVDWIWNIMADRNLSDPAALQGN